MHLKNAFKKWRIVDGSRRELMKAQLENLFRQKTSRHISDKVYKMLYVRMVKKSKTPDGVYESSFAILGKSRVAFWGTNKTIERLDLNLGAITHGAEMLGQNRGGILVQPKKRW